MKAVVCSELGLPDALTLEQNWPEPACGPDQVRIAVKAAGLNFPDLLIIQGKYQAQPELPFIPGGECSGDIIEVGDQVSHLAVGDAVLGITPVGAFAQEVVIDARTVMPIPASLSYAQAAGIGITYFTSYHALKQRAALQPGETLLVLGAAGGVGATAIEIGKLMGAHVIAAASTDEKLAFCRQLGADEVINYSTADLKATLKTMTKGRGVDVIYDPVGGDFTEPAVRSMAWNGRYLVIGFASGPIPKIPLNLALLKGCALMGVFWGRFASEEPAVQQQNVRELWQFFSDRKLVPQVTDHFALHDYLSAFACMTERRARGKVILTMD